MPHKRKTPSARNLLILAVILLLGFALRVGFAAGEYRLHPDEALFSTFARRAALNGNWLLHGDLDKPPLSIYANALSMLLFAARPRETVLDFTSLQGEFAARLPALFASLITIASIYSTARRLFASSIRSLSTAALIAFSPLAIVFSATAFTDGLMLCAGALALRGIAGKQWGWAGFWIGAALASKQQGLFLLPLILLVGWAVDGIGIKRLMRLALPIIGWGAALILWDASRGQATGFWALASVNNEVSRLIRFEELLPRLTQWTVYLFSIVGIAGIPLIGLSVFSGQSLNRREKRIERALLFSTAAYLALHIVIAFNVYDRYALLLLLPVTLLLSRGVVTLKRLWQTRPPQVAWAIASLTGVLMLCGGMMAANGVAPVGGDMGDGRWGRYAGINELADSLNAKPVATVIYDRWLGWELGFYMGEWNDKRRVHFPTPDALADGAEALEETAPRYLVAPLSEPIAPWLDALHDRNFTISLDHTVGNFLVYQVDPPITP